MHIQYNPTDVKILKIIHMWKKFEIFSKMPVVGYSLNSRFKMILKLSSS